jgi:ABC-type dipeptide/oligopeptide/nickel transport system permease subunit
MQSAGESGVRFNLRRLANAFRSLTRSRLAIVGIILLIIFTFSALVGPIAFPVDPQANTVSAPDAQPEWISYFPEGFYLSRNMQVPSGTSLTTPSSLQQFSYAVNPASQLPQVSFSFSNTFGNVSSGLLIASSSAAVATAGVSTGFVYPYRGAPASFTAHGVFVAEGVSVSQPITVSFFITRGSAKTFSLGSFNLTQNGLHPTSDLITGSNSFEGVQGSLPFAETVFANINNYTFGFTAKFYGASRLYVGTLRLLFYGTSFGILGTDSSGYDLFAQDVYGARSSLFVGLLAAAIGIGLGLFVGLVAGFMTGTVDQVLMRFTDMMLVIPALPLLLVLVGVLGPSLTNIIIIIGFLGWMGFARVIRSQVLSLKERPFIEAAKAAGAGTRHILSRHIFPNVVSLTYVNLALAVPAAILTEAALSFLGLGDPSVISWGQILYRWETATAFATWWWVVPPGLAIALISLSFVLIGYSLDEIFNPRLRRRR